MSTPSDVAIPALSNFDRYRSMFAVTLVGSVLVIGIGRLVLSPIDPQGSASVLSTRLGWMSPLVAALFAAVLAGLVAWLDRGKLSEMGVFGVTLGLGLANLRHDNAAQLWRSIGQADDNLRSLLAVYWSIETVTWGAVVMAALAGSRVAIKYFKLKPIIETSLSSEYRRGAATILFMSVTALVAIQLFAAGTELAPIQTGQVYFSCAMAFYLAAFFGYQFTGAQNPLWAYISVIVVAVLGYLWTAANPTPTFPGRDITHYAHFSPTAYGRALPLEIVMVGTTAAIFGIWHYRQITRYAQMQESKST